MVAHRSSGIQPNSGDALTDFAPVAGAGGEQLARVFGRFRLDAPNRVSPAPGL
jgi:hypothetical protein